MNTLPSLAAAVFVFCSFISAGTLRALDPPPGLSNAEVEDAAKSITLDHIRYEKTDFDIALEHIRTKTRKANERLNILLHVPTDWQPPKLTMDLKKISVRDALQSVIKPANLRMSIVHGTILLHPESMGPRERKTPGLTDSPAWQPLSLFEIDRLSFGEADLADVCLHVVKKSEQAGLTLNLVPASQNTRPVTLDLRQAVVRDIIEILAELTDQEITAFGNILVLGPAPAATKPDDKTKSKAASEWMKSPAWKRTEEIVVDRISFAGASGADAAAGLVKKSRETDQEKKGVSISISGVAGITIDIRQAKVSDILRVLAEIHGLDISVEKDEIRLTSERAKTGRRNAEGIIIPKIEYRDMELNDCLEHIAHASVQTRPDGTKSGITVLNRMNNAKNVTLSLQNVPAWEALEKVAAAAGGELQQDGYRLVIAPRRRDPVP